jgi:hypothetical protein
MYKYLQKVIIKKIFLADILKVTDENSRIRIRIRMQIRINKPEVWICGSESVQKFHGSATRVFSSKMLKRTFSFQPFLQAMREFLEETTRNQEEEDDEVAVQLKTSRPSPSPDNRASYLGGGYFVQCVDRGPQVEVL